MLAALGLAVCQASCSSLPATQPIPETLEEQVSVFGAEAAALRGLPKRKSVPAGIQTEAELRASMQQLMREEYGETERELEAAYKLFGLLPPEMDLLTYLIELYTGQVAGYYDPKSGRFFIKEDPADEGEPVTSEGAEDGANRQFVIAHEFAHALQDQYFDLLGLDERFEDQADRSLATTALIEGDAMLVGLDHMAWRIGLPVSTVSPLGRLVTGALGTQATDNLDDLADEELSEAATQLRDAPPVIAASLTFPYIQGMRFALALRSEFGQVALDQAFADPPDSSEQIFYPERYFDRRDWPSQIELRAPPEGYRARADQTLGMLDLRVMLETYTGSSRAAEGWDGDRFAIWESAKSDAPPLLVWLTAWDSEREAKRFERDYARVLENKRGDQRFALARDQRRVAIVEGGRDEPLADFAALLLESEVKTDPREQPRPTLLARAVTWPLRFERLDRARSAQILGGNALGLRWHSAGYRLSLARGALLRSERTPDRSAHSTALGLVWWSRDRLHDYTASAIPAVMSFQRRGSGEERRIEWHIGQTLVLPSLVRWRSGPGGIQTSLAGLVRIRLGADVPRGERLRLLFGLIPLPI